MKIGYIRGTMLVVTMGILLMSCGTAMIKGQTWLDSKTDKPEFNISGSWTSLEWGVAQFTQNGRDVTGTLGDYPVRGVVSGNTIYLLMYSGNSIHYSAELKSVNKNVFSGWYSKYYLVDEMRDDPTVTRPMTITAMSTSS